MRYEHMNASKGSEKTLTDRRYVAEEKFDGVRFIYDHGHLWTRNGHDKALWLPSIISRFSANFVLDMEVLVPHGTSKDMQSFIATKEPADDSALTYRVFDVLESDGHSYVNLPWVERRRILDTLAKHYGFTVTTVYDLPDYHELFTKVTNSGGEGLMLKNREAIYKPGKRPANTWYKFKQHDTDDVIITGFTQGEGKFKGLIGSVCFSDGQSRTGSCSGMDNETRILMTSKQTELIGRTIEISYMEKTPTAYRHPVFVTLREDK